MASAFNLTAQINLAGPANIKPVVGQIQKGLKGIKANVDINIDKRTAAQLRAINKNITSLNTSLKNLNQAASQAGRGLGMVNNAASSNKVSRAAGSMNKLASSSKNAATSLQGANKQLAKSNNLMQAFGKHVSLAAKKFAAFSLVTGVIYRVSNAIDVAVSEFIEFDRQLTRVSQVTGTSMQGLQGLERTVRSLATGLGVSSQSLIKVSTTLAQAGLTAEQTRQALSALAKTSLAPTFGDINETVEGSIALMRQFNISTKDLEQALGSINAVASQFAVESQDIITAIKRAGGVFAAASKGVAEGTDALNQFIAIFTSVRATTREGAETIATGLRTIFTRIQRGDTIEKLKGIGVELTDLEGKFVGPYEAVRRLSIALGGLDPRSAKFAAIAEELGGFRQIGKVIPLLQQFNTAQAAYFAAQKGGNSLTKDATIAQQALSTQIQKTREQFISFIASLSNNQGLKNMATLALKAASAILKIAEAIGPALPALSIMLGGKLARTGLGMITGKKFAAGGVVPGTGSGDTVPAMLTPGEFVIRKKAVGAIGVGNLQRMNKYASGGSVMDHPESRRFVNTKTTPDKAARVPILEAVSSDPKLTLQKKDKIDTTITRQGFSGKALAEKLSDSNASKKNYLNALENRNHRMRGIYFEDVLKDSGLIDKKGGGGSRIDAYKGNQLIEIKSTDEPASPGALMKKVAGAIFNPVSKNVDMKASKIASQKALSKKVDTIGFGGLTVFEDRSRFAQKKLEDRSKKRQRRATGGGISGSDTVPALLTPGEFVINKKAASRIGASKLHSMNRADKITGYNKGGFVQKFATGGGVDDVAAGLSRKDAAMLQQAAKSNVDAFKELEKLTRGWPVEDVASAYKNLARSINKGEADMSVALDKAVTQTAKGSGGAERGPSRQERLAQRQIEVEGGTARMDKRNIDQYNGGKVPGAYQGSYAQQDDELAYKEKALKDPAVQKRYDTKVAKEQIQKKLGSGTQKTDAATTRAMKVFAHELNATGSRTAAFAAALDAGMKHTTAFDRNLAKTSAALQRAGNTIQNAGNSIKSGGSFIVKAFKNVGSAIPGGKMIGGIGGKIGGKMMGGYQKIMGGNTAGAVARRGMAAAGVTAAAGMGVSGLTEMMKGGSFLAGATGNADPDLKATDNSIMAAQMGQGALSGASMGAQIGSIFGPWGTAIGGAVGALGGLTMGFINARKEIAKAAAQEKKERQQKFAEQDKKSLAIATDQSKGGAERKAARETYLARIQANKGAGLDTAKDLMKTGSSADEAASAGATAAANAVQFITSEASRTGKDLSQMQASMPAGEFDALKQSILNADAEYLKAVKAHGENSAAAKAAADKAMENVQEMAKTNAELARQRKAVAAMAKVSASFVRTARSLSGAIDAAENSFNHAAQEMATITDPTASVSYRNTNLETVTNPAATGAEQQKAYSQMAQGLGPDGQAMANMAAMPKNLESSISKSIAKTVNSQDSEAVEKDLQKTVMDQLMAAGVDKESASEAAGKFAGRISGMTPAERQNLDVQKEISNDPALSAMMDGANASAEALQKYSRSVTSAFQFLADQAKQTAAAEQGLRDAHADSIGQRMANEDRLNAILGKGQGIQAKLNRINEKGAAQRNARLGGGANISADPVQAAGELVNMINTNQAEAANSRAQRSTDLSGGNAAAVKAESEGELAMSRFAQQAKTAEEELRKLPGQLQGSIDAVLSEMESVMAHRSAQIDAGAGLMEKALGSTPSEMMKLSKTMNLAGAAAQGFAPTIQQSEAAQKAYQKTIQGGGSQKQAQSAAQQAYAQESSDSLGMLKEMMPLLTAAGPEGKAEANKMMANAYESQFAARGIDINQTPFGKIIEMMRQDPGEDPQIAALKQQYQVLEQQKTAVEGVIQALDQSKLTAAHEAANQIVVDKLDQIQAVFEGRQQEGEKDGVPRPTAPPKPAASSPKAAAAAASGAAGGPGGAAPAPGAPAPGAPGAPAPGAPGAPGAPAPGAPAPASAAAVAAANAPAGSTSAVYGSASSPYSTAAAPAPSQTDLINEKYAQESEANKQQAMFYSAGRDAKTPQLAYKENILQQRRIAYAKRTGNKKGLKEDDQKLMDLQDKQNTLESRKQEELKKMQAKTTGSKPGMAGGGMWSVPPEEVKGKTGRQTSAKDKATNNAYETMLKVYDGIDTKNTAANSRDDKAKQSVAADQTVTGDVSIAILEQISQNTAATIEAIKNSSVVSSKDAPQPTPPAAQNPLAGIDTSAAQALDGTQIGADAKAMAAGVDKTLQNKKAAPKPPEKPKAKPEGWMGAIGSVLTAPTRFTGSMIESATGIEVNRGIENATGIPMTQDDIASSAGGFAGSVAAAPARFAGGIAGSITGTPASEQTTTAGAIGGAVGSAITAPARYMAGAMGISTPASPQDSQQSAQSSASGSNSSSLQLLKEIANSTKALVQNSSGAATAQKSGDGVNTNGLAQFTDKLNKLFEQLANVSIPSEIKLSGAFDVNVALNGLEVWKTMEPKIKEMILTATGEQINEFAGENFGGEGKTKKVPIGSQN
jgi:hypothetical protein